MRKQLFVTGALLLAALGARAQDTPVLPAVPQPPPDPTLVKPATDSVQAVRNLFRKRRNGGTAYTSVGGLVLATGVLAGPFSLGATESVAISVPFLAVGVGKLVRFGHKKEEAIIKQYQAGKPLPAAVRKRLRQEHFEPAR
ncbi:hypothetical protein [Hymenobacter jeollabukensis]|uniref:Uncharacterized protein n=1 Tax=Hymenobacter jeollabukensis TaxID=2025313 RepID=A0A5R8WRC0_9BACT|nr:hypothetical protein [Hymenobacter jeollabukensis]TLM93003.1 hypothetical protein FDY95_10215 [Hymenobacter jeollabukensis]